MITEIRLATIRHIEDLLPLVAAYHEFEGVVQDPQKRRNAVAEMLITPDFGFVWRIYSDDALAGYIAITLGYSIEFGGKDGFVDEFYLSTEFRGKGIGKKVLTKVLEQLRNDEIKALHLEVAQSNQRARELYEALGFELRDQYHLMSCQLEEMKR